MALMKLVGSSVRRVEDPRFLRGQAQYVDDVRLPGMLHAAFVRSPHAHAKIVGIDTKRALAVPGVRRVFTGEDTKHLKPLGLPFRPEIFPREVFKQGEWPVLARGKVRYVGEPIAVVIAESRYAAEDGAEQVDVDYAPLDPAVDPEAAMKPGGPLVHEELGDNIRMHFASSAGDVEAAFRKAAFVLRERFHTNRHCAHPMEGRATLAKPEPNGDVTLWTSTQMPHMVRTRSADIIGFPEHKLRVIGPDVGGGFGLKCHVFPEEPLTCWLALQMGAPVKWLEDRRENLVNSFHAKEDIVYCEMGFASDGTLLGMRAKIIGDLGAYSADPWPSAFEALQLAAGLPGPYRLRDYDFVVDCVATNKTTLSVYRGVGLPAAVLVHEHMMDLAARRLNVDPAALRKKNMIRPDEFPYVSASGLQYDTGSSTDALDKALGMADYAGFAKRRQDAERRGRRLGIGICTYIEQTGFGTGYWKPFGIQHCTYDSAIVRMDPSGGVTLSVGTFSHGQGHHTTYAQMLADELGVRVEDVSFHQGDTLGTAYGWGTWGSRSVVAGGGAVVGAARKVREKMLRIAGHMLEASPSDLEVVPGKVQVKGVASKSVAVADIAKAAVFSIWRLADGEEPGLEATQYYDPPPTTYANATHVAEVEVDPETGAAKIVRYVVVEDCGRIINPMIVDAQVVGGVVQGIGEALFEHLQYDEHGQLLTTSLMDYLVPTAADVPDFEVGHIETLSPTTANGVKGMGEGGTIAAPAAIANAIANALASSGAKVNTLPLTPERVWTMASQGAPRD
jgi:carbon-monoxide dehydrogenase large subunit